VRDFTANTSIKVEGKMNPTDTYRIARMYAVAALILAASLGLSALVYAVRWW